ncbi:hypothetical protein LDO31_00100 [Luteimonas sp. XNQY3]|nr:hypothetical protein [Luteimonas sp. XNQY3]MCD9004652.1 hypothetical protein [Luteimonas sp. XNQY3]
MPDAIAHHAALDARMVAAARGIRVLSLASWSPQAQQRFLSAFAAGRCRRSHMHGLPANSVPAPVGVAR